MQAFFLHKSVNISSRFGEGKKKEKKRNNLRRESRGIIRSIESRAARGALQRKYRLQRTSIFLSLSSPLPPTHRGKSAFRVDDSWPDPGILLLVAINIDASALPRILILSFHLKFSIKTSEKGEAILWKRFESQSRDKSSFLDFPLASETERENLLLNLFPFLFLF